MIKEINLNRRFFYENATVGQLTFDDNQSLYSLEPAVRPDGFKLKGRTAIPLGRYQVVPYDSPKHNMEVPLLKNVPGFSMIEIHIGNTFHDTQGCILLGCTYSLTPEVQKVVYSRKAYFHFYEWIKQQWRDGNEVWLTVE